MPKFTFHMGIDVRSYGNVEVDADTVEAAVALLTPDNVSEKFERGEITWDSPSNLSIIDATSDTDGDLPEWSGHDIVDPDAPVYTQQQFEDNMAELLDKTMRRRGQLAVLIEGGIVQGVVTNGPVLVGVPVSVIDYDTDGAQEDSLVDIVQADGTTEPASVESHEVRIATITIPGASPDARNALALLARARAMLDSDLTTHIFDESNGDTVPTDDPHVLLIAEIDMLLGDNPPTTGNNEYLNRYPEAVRPFADRAYNDGYVDGRADNESDATDPDAEIFDGWTVADNAAAVEEGWLIMQRSGDGTLAIQRDDEVADFDDDDMAIACVRMKAAEGSQLHQRALTIHNDGLYQRAGIEAEWEHHTNTNCFVRTTDGHISYAATWRELAAQFDLAVEEVK